MWGTADPTDGPDTTDVTDPKDVAAAFVWVACGSGGLVAHAPRIMDRKETGAAILVNKVGLFRSKLRRTTACGAEVGRSWRPIEGKPGAVLGIHTGRGTGGETGESTAARRMKSWARA
jgi:hypothetical protein